MFATNLSEIAIMMHMQQVLNKFLQQLSDVLRIIGGYGYDDCPELKSSCVILLIQLSLYPRLKMCSCSGLSLPGEMLHRLTQYSCCPLTKQPQSWRWTVPENNASFFFSNIVENVDQSTVMFKT